MDFPVAVATVVLACRAKRETRSGRLVGRRAPPPGFYSFANEADALLEYIHRDVSFVFRHNEWRSDAYRVRATSQEQDAAFERQFHDAVPLIMSYGFSGLVLDDLHANHQATAADIAHHFVFLRPVGHALHHVVADLGSVVHQV